MASAASTATPNISELHRPADGQQFYVEPEALKIFRFSLYAVIIVFALVGNVTVCVISRRNRRLQRSTYCFIMNLAVSDIGSVLCLPFLLPELFIGNWTPGSRLKFDLEISPFLIGLTWDAVRAGL